MPLTITGLKISHPNRTITAKLSDQREITIPIGWQPRLHHATTQERNEWQLTRQGNAVHWPQLDETITLQSLLNGQPAGENPISLPQWLESRRAATDPVPTENSKCLKMLDQAEIHFANHHFTEGGDLVWNAAFQAAAAAAHALGLPCNNKKEAYEVAEYLEQNRPNSEPTYVNYLLNAGIYPTLAANQCHLAEDQWSPQEYIEYLPHKRKLVTALEAIAQNPIAPNPPSTL